MPGGDGTGPFGNGPRTGRGRGYCRSSFNKYRPSTGSNFKLLDAVIPIAAALIKSLATPNGILRSLFNKRLQNTNKTVNNKPIETEYTVIDEKSNYNEVEKWQKPIKQKKLK